MELMGGRAAACYTVGGCSQRLRKTPEISSKEHPCLHFPIDWRRPSSAAKTRCSWDSIPAPNMLPPGLLAECDAARPEKTAAAYEQFCREIIDVVARRVPAVKPQAAFFEELGPAGMAALAGAVRYARAGADRDSGRQTQRHWLDRHGLRPRHPGTRQSLGRRRADRQSLSGR